MMNWTLLKHSLRKLGESALRQTARTQAVCAEIDRLKAGPRYQDKKCLVPFGHKIYSQTDEDGIIREIFNRIGVTNKVFVEFGVGNGLENNTLALLFDGWKGLWIEGSRDYTRMIEAGFPMVIRKRLLTVTNAFVTKDNINDLISVTLPRGQIDLLSVDIDGNDYHVFNAINCVSPRAVVMEYNAKFVPPLEYCMAHNAAHVWRGDDCFGASLKFLEVALARRGYCLVGCNLSGGNSFFVRQDLVGDKFLMPFTAEQHFEPSRYYLAGMPSGHRPSYQTLERSVALNA
jgi:hypothetical protein